MKRDSWEWNWFGFLRIWGRVSSVSQESSHDCPQLDGWRTIPGLLPAASQAHHHLRSTSSANAATGGTTTLLHNRCPAPACSTSSLVQQHHQSCHSQAVTLYICGGPKGGRGGP